MASFELRTYGELSPELVERLQHKAMRSIEDFSVCFLLGNELAGSGTLVDISGALGILTAFHVADHLMSYPERALTLVIGEFLHRFELPRKALDHVVVGKPNPDQTASGPDLSFIKILDPEKLSTLKSKKSFCRIDAKSFSEIDNLPPQGLFWWTAGAPAELSTPMTSTSREGAGRAGFLIARVDFVELTKKPSGFDVLRLAIPAAERPFATNYKGYSGGGVWVSALTKDSPGAGDETIDIDAARLAGVMYYQTELLDGRRLLLANGPGSLLHVKSPVPN